MTWLQRQLSSILALSLEGERMEVAHVAKKRGQVTSLKEIELNLSSDPLTADPITAGKELRQCLVDHGIREKRCIVGIPLDRLFAVQTDIPELSDEDLTSFLEIEAERELPMSPDELYLVLSKVVIPPNQPYGSILALPHQVVAHLERVFTEAGLSLVSISPAAAALPSQTTESSPDMLVLWFRRNQAELMLQTQGGPLMLRAIDFSRGLLDEPSKAAIETLSRDLRITLGQIPSQLRSQLKGITLIGESATTATLRPVLESSLSALNLSFQAVEDSPKTARPLASSYLTKGRPNVEFLPPKTSHWQVWSKKLAGRSTLVATTATAIVVLGPLTAFIWQGQQLAHLEATWSGMAEEVAQLETLQTRIKTFGPWFQEEVPSLSIARLITKSFPEEGSIWVGRLEIHQQSEVACAGFARNNQTLLSTLDRLSASDQVDQLKIQQVRGDRTLQFAFTFQWRKTATQ